MRRSAAALLQADSFKKAPPKRAPGGGSQAPRSRAPKQPRAASGDASKRRRTETTPARTVRPGRYTVAPPDVEVPADGVFRAVVNLSSITPTELGVTQGKGGRWLATIDCAGEAYQACFEDKDAALEVARAAGIAC